MEEKADPTVLYLHPEGKMALKRYALDRGSKVRVHDLLLEAIEQWARSKGLDVPFRVPSQRAKGSIAPNVHISIWHFKTMEFVFRLILLPVL
jgi:hypothetical protein